MIIIVQEQDYPKLSSTFIHNRVMATKFSTEGLYLNKKNITLMVCIEKEREEEILDYIRQSCTERMEERQVCEYNGMTMVDVTKGVKVGGAIVFFLDVDRMMTKSFFRTTVVTYCKSGFCLYHNYLALSIISINLHLLVLLKGRVSMMRTVSPIWHSFFSS